MDTFFIIFKIPWNYDLKIISIFHVKKHKMSGFLVSCFSVKFVLFYNRITIFILTYCSTFFLVCVEFLLVSFLSILFSISAQHRDITGHLEAGAGDQGGLTLHSDTGDLTQRVSGAQLEEINNVFIDFNGNFWVLNDPNPFISK